MKYTINYDGNQNSLGIGDDVGDGDGDGGKVIA